MKKWVIIIIAVICVSILSVLFFNKPQQEKPARVMPAYENISYVLDGKTITLSNGIAKSDPVEGSSSVILTKYFGNETKADFNNDGLEDIAFLITQDTAGSGIFYYVVAALGTNDGSYIGTNGIFLGDRIAPQSTNFQDGQIIVNYADRKPGEPMTASQSVGVSRYFQIDQNKLVEIKK